MLDWPRRRPAGRMRGRGSWLGTGVVSRRTQLGAPGGAPVAGCCVQHTCEAPCGKRVAQWVADALPTKAGSAAELCPVGMSTPPRGRGPRGLRGRSPRGPVASLAPPAHEAWKAPWNRRTQEDQTDACAETEERSAQKRAPSPPSSACELKKLNSFGQASWPGPRLHAGCAGPRAGSRLPVLGETSRIGHPVPRGLRARLRCFLFSWRGGGGGGAGGAVVVLVAGCDFAARRGVILLPASGVSLCGRLRRLPPPLRRDQEAFFASAAAAGGDGARFCGKGE